jgi:hypothetical protein
MIPYLTQHGVNIIETLGAEKNPAETNEVKREDTAKNTPE